MQPTFSAEEIGSAVGVSRPFIVNASRKQAWPFVWGASDSGRKTKLFALEALPENYRPALELYAAAKARLSLGIAPDSAEPKDPTPAVQEAAQAPAYNRKRLEKYTALLQKFEHLNGKRLRAAIAEHNAECPKMKTSYRAIMNARQERQAGASLIGKYGNRRGETTVPDVLFQYYAGLRMKEGSPSTRICHTATIGYGVEQGFTPDSIASRHAFERRLRREYSQSARCYAQEGPSAWNRKFAGYVERDYSRMRAGQGWVSDHHQLDVGVEIGLSNGKRKIAFPWVTVFRDVKTGKWLGWSLHIEAPSSDHIFHAFFLAAERYGKPEFVYFDNGKDYRCRDLSGGVRNVRVEMPEARARSAFGLLDIKVTFAKVRNAQAKTVERDFRLVKETLGKPLPGYRGGHVKERPEALKDEIAAGKLLGFEEFSSLFSSYVEEVLNKLPSHGKVHKGRSRDDVWAVEFTIERQVSRDALAFCCMRTSKDMPIGRNGVRDSELQVTYWAEWMSPRKGERVYLRRDPTAYHEAWVFEAATDQFLGKAELATASAAYAQTEVERAELKREVARKAREKREVKRELARIEARPDPARIIEHMAAGLRATKSEEPETVETRRVQVLVPQAEEAMELERQERKRQADSQIAEVMPIPPRPGLPKKLYPSAMHKILEEQQALKQAR